MNARIDGWERGKPLLVREDFEPWLSEREMLARLRAVARAAKLLSGDRRWGPQLRGGAELDAALGALQPGDLGGEEG